MVFHVFRSLIVTSRVTDCEGRESRTLQWKRGECILYVPMQTVIRMQDMRLSRR